MNSLNKLIDNLRHIAITFDQLPDWDAIELLEAQQLNAFPQCAILLQPGRSFWLVVDHHNQDPFIYSPRTEVNSQSYKHNF